MLGLSCCFVRTFSSFGFFDPRLDQLRLGVPQARPQLPEPDRDIENEPSQKKTKFTRQRRLTALARSVQKAARTPSDSQADSVDDYTKAKLKQGCSVRKAARTPSDSQADSIDSAGKSNAATNVDSILGNP